ncbi:UNVERIFIED_CONTAM: hypothetical protein PYX00_007820 [Menopon gallinae]|uniref:Thioredoxin domain-containing protein n=1 Tax=Menopon gallinae TaxID=328185 RepID=A0AAW2HKG2_9NEOP
MEILVSLSGILKDIVKDVEDEATKEDFVIEHIKNVTKSDLLGLQFPQGKDWFNVSRPLTHSDLSGKVVVLDFFTYCCINCLHLVPHLRALEETFSVADGLVVIGVHSAKFENEKNSSNIALALKRHNITHPVINDSNGYMWDKLNISCWPTVLIIGPNGEALFVLVGEQCHDELFLYVETTLKYYKNKISPHSLPVNYNNVVSSSILSFPGKITRIGNTLAVSDSGNHRILILDESGCIKYKIGGKTSGFQDGSLQEAKFNSPQGVAFYNEFEIYVADTENHAIRLIDLKKETVKTVVGNGKQGIDFVGGKTGKLQEISSPWDLCFVPALHIKEHFTSSFGPNNMGNLKGPGLFPSMPPPPPLPPGSAPLPPPNSPVPKKDTVEGGTENLDEKNVLLIAMSGIHQIWALFLKDTNWWKGKKYEKDVCVAIAGSGKEENRNNRYPMMASFAQPSGLIYNRRYKAVFVADSESSSIRKLSLEDGSVSHMAGGDKNPNDLFNFGDTDGKGFSAKLQHPLGVTCSETGDVLYVCDTYNNKLKKIRLATMECSSLHEEGNLFNEPGGCVLDEKEEKLFVADTNNNAIVSYNLGKNVRENVVITEPEEAPKTVKEDSWELETEINNRGGELTLVLRIGPEDVHGSWKIDVNTSKVESDRLKGEITSAPQELLFKFLPTQPETVDVPHIILNLSFCEKDVCLFKKFLIKLVTKRTHDGKDVRKLEFDKTVS